MHTKQITRGTFCLLVNNNYNKSFSMSLADLVIPIKTIFPGDAWYPLLSTRLLFLPCDIAAVLVSDRLSTQFSE